MPASKTHNEIMLRPPPGVRFSIWGADVRLEFQRGREREIVSWLRTWIDMYIEPEALKAEALAQAQNGNLQNENKPKIDKTVLQKMVDDLINQGNNEENTNE